MAREMPKFTPASPDVIERFQAAVAKISNADLRKMFGYPAAFVAGNMFAGVFGESVFVRLAESERAELLREKDAKPFEPMPGRRMAEYVVIPPSLQRQPAKLAGWLARAHTYAAPPKVPRAARVRKR